MKRDNMRILNVGSINMDHVYGVDHFVRPGETLNSSSYHIFAGGKGFNQSIALARAGAATHHLGGIGEDGGWLLQRLEQEGVDTEHVKIAEGATGHAIIQVVPSGENAIVLHGGANTSIDESEITNAISSCSAGDYLLVQNETSSVTEAIRNGSEHELRVVFNPAPMSSLVRNYPLECVDVFILNETEANGLTGKIEPEEIRAAICTQFPQAATVLTLGSRGAVYFDSEVLLRQPAVTVDAVDTTAAGDTFIGYFLAELMQSGDPAEALSLGCRAAAICVTRSGASNSIPSREETDNY